MKIHEANKKGYKHKNLIFWLAMIESLSRPIEPEDVVLDLGCGSGLFLQLLYEENIYRQGIGIDSNAEAIEEASKNLQKRCGAPVSYLKSTPEEFLLNRQPESIDIIFCQEVLWMNQQLEPIAETIFKLLKPGGRCYLTVGNHPENPAWMIRRTRLKGCDNVPYSHLLDEIAEVFSKTGFAVGMRRMPLDGFIMFHPEETAQNVGSFSKLVSSSYEHKMLFYFGKTGQVEKSKNIYD
jgi:SAM-dependent methyltransferase